MISKAKMIGAKPNITLIGFSCSAKEEETHKTKGYISGSDIAGSPFPIWSCPSRPIMIVLCSLWTWWLYIFLKYRWRQGSFIYTILFRSLCYNRKLTMEGRMLHHPSYEISRYPRRHLIPPHSKALASNLSVSRSRQLSLASDPAPPSTRINHFPSPTQKCRKGRGD